MTTVKIATKNPVKIEAIKKAFERFFSDVEIECFSVCSGVPNQPIGDATFIGAENRLEDLKLLCGDYDYLVACESGLICEYGKWFNVQVVMVENKDGKCGTGLSNGYEVPMKYLDDVMNTSIAKVLDKVFQGKGGIRVLTKNQFTRADLIEHGTIMALTRVINGEMW